MILSRENIELIIRRFGVPSLLPTNGRAGRKSPGAHNQVFCLHIEICPRRLVLCWYVIRSHEKTHRTQCGKSSFNKKPKTVSATPNRRIPESDRCQISGKVLQNRIGSKSLEKEDRRIIRRFGFPACSRPTGGLAGNPGGPQLIANCRFYIAD